MDEFDNTMIGRGRDAIDMIVDPDTFQENAIGTYQCEPDYGPCAAVGTAQLKGRPVTIIANDAQQFNERFPVVFGGVIGMEEAYKMAYAVFDRSNPSIKTTDKLKYSSYGTAKAVLDFVMRERQREFFGEGKRWFDMVRMAIRDNSTENMLNLLAAKYTTNGSAIKAKLATLNSLYSPVYKEEMKVNTALVQNPAWVVDETIVKN